MDISTSVAAALAAELERKNPEAFEAILEQMRSMVIAHEGKLPRRCA